MRVASLILVLTLVVWLVADFVARPYQPTQNYKRVVTLQISTNTAINYTTGYAPFLFTIVINLQFNEK